MSIEDNFSDKGLRLSSNISQKHIIEIQIIIQNYKNKIIFGLKDGYTLKFCSCFLLINSFLFF